MRKILIITSLIITALVLLGACIPAGEPVAPEQPSQNQLNFHLSTNTTAGNTDEYDSYVFSLYLETGQELFLEFSAVGAKLRVSLFTPSEETWGYNPNPSTATTTEAGELGRLEKGRIVSAEKGSFRFAAPESGYYLVTLQSASPKAEIDVTLDYQIQ